MYADPGRHRQETAAGPSASGPQGDPPFLERICRRRTGAFGLLEILVSLAALAALTAIGAPLAEDPPEDEARPVALTCSPSHADGAAGPYCPLPE